MKKSIFTIILLFLITLPICSQEAKSLFRSMPDSLAPLLSADNRADFIDFLNSKMKAEVKNSFGNKSEMTDLTNDYINIQMTEASTWQMKLLPANDSTKVICIVSTACAPACDSNIRFYTTKWEPLQTDKYIKLPNINDFFRTPVSTDPTDSLVYQYNEIRPMAEMLLIKISLNKLENSLSIDFTTPDYIGKESAEKMKPFLHTPIIYYWEKGKFTTK